MSVEIITTEEITIRNENDATKELIRELERHYRALDYVRVSGLELIADGERIQENAEDPLELAGKLNQKEKSPFYSLLGKAANAKRITVRMTYEAEGEYYGYGYWQGVLKDNLKNYVTCRCMEYYDSDDGICMYRFDDACQDQVPWNASYEDVSSVTKWFSYNFYFMVETDDIDLTQGECGTYMKGFIDKMKQKYQVGNSTLEEDLMDLSDSVSVDQTGLKELMKDTQDFLDFCVAYDLEPQVTLPFVAEEPKMFFAAADLTVADGKVKPEYCVI